MLRLLGVRGATEGEWEGVRVRRCTNWKTKGRRSIEGIHRTNAETCPKGGSGPKGESHMLVEVEIHPH